MKIVVLDGQTLNPGDLSWDCIEKFGDLTVYDRTNGEDLAIQRIGDSEIVILNKTPITQRILESCPSIKLICVLATGYNVVDCSAAAKRGIPVCNAPGYSTNAVAQFTFGLLLELCHQIGHHSKLVHDGAWTRRPNFCFWDTPQMELTGKTLGIIGFGSIGQAVAKIAQAMGMQVLAYTRTRRPEFSHVYTDLDTLLSSSDVISLHCPLFPETEKIINAQSIAKMKDGAILLNTARGPLIDEQAVADALRSGKLLGAAMDVVCAEPIAADNPLLTAPNCIITPHIAWAPMETRKRILDITTNSIQGFLDGNLVNVINM